MNRYSWLDYMKVLGILMVASNHSNPPEFVGRLNSATDMPLFLFAAGFLTPPDAFAVSLKEFFQRRIRRVLHAYILLGMLVGFLCSTDAWGGSEFWSFWGDRVKMLMYSSGSMNSDLSLSPVSLWFVPALLSALMMTYFVYKIGSPIMRGVVVVVLGVVAHFISGIALPWEFETACAAVLFVVIGHEVRRRPRLLTGLQSMPGIGVALVLSLGITLAVTGPRFDFRSTGFVHPLWSYPASLLLLAGCAMLTMRLPSHKSVRLLSEATLWISALHIPAYWRIDDTVAMVTGLEVASFRSIPAYGFAKVVATVGFLLVVFPLARRCMPFIFQPAAKPVVVAASKAQPMPDLSS